jgi:hypothetical protein
MKMNRRLVLIFSLGLFFLNPFTGFAADEDQLPPANCIKFPDSLDLVYTDESDTLLVIDLVQE